MGHDPDVLRLLASAYDMAPDPVVALDDSLRMAYVNQAAAKLAGKDVSLLVGEVCHRAILGVEEPCEACRAHDALARRERCAAHKRTVMPDGRTVHIEQQWFPLEGTNGGPRLVVECLRDVTALRSAEEALTHSAAYAEQLRAERNTAQSYLDVAASVFMRLDTEGRVMMMNRKGLQVLGRSADEVIGHDWFGEFVRKQDSARLREECAECLRPSGAKDRVVRCHVVRPDGEVRAVEWHTTVVHDEHGEPVGVLASGNDVTERLAAEEELRFRSTVLDEATDDVIVHTPDGRAVFANKRALELRGMLWSEFVALPPFGWVPEGYREIVFSALEQVEREGHAVYESACKGADGKLIPIEVRATQMDWNGQRVIARAGRDISERKAAEEIISRMAFYDSLTGLANRALFSDRLTHALEATKRCGTSLALVFLDVDHFKAVNDSLGHRLGDELLIQVAERLSSAVRASDTVARLGGDEFTIIFEGVQDAREAEALGLKLLAALTEPFSLDGEPLVVSASAGIVLSPQGETDAETLLRQADIAMYEAKDAGRNSVCMYDPKMSEGARARFDLKNDLPAALERDEFVIHYQPQFSVLTGDLTGVEALVRWQHPTRGLLQPDSFLPAAEESGYVIELGWWVLRRACAQVAVWQAHLAPGLGLAVNLSARQFEDPSLVRALERLITETRITPSTLELEITESVAMRDAIYLRSTLERVRELGVRLAIDDFGMGFSSFDQLMRLDVNTIKLDRRFVSDLSVDARAAAITRAVIFLGHSLGLRVVAEGVECDAHLTFLREQRCDVAQGFHLGQPLRVDDLERLLRPGVAPGC